MKRKTEPAVELQEEYTQPEQEIGKRELRSACTQENVRC